MFQEYHFVSRDWNVIETQGYPVKGGYGHSAIFDKSTKKIFVYGGYVSISSSAAEISNSLYAFDIHASRFLFLIISAIYLLNIDKFYRRIISFMLNIFGSTIFEITLTIFFFLEGETFFTPVFNNFLVTSN